MDKHRAVIAQLMGEVQKDIGNAAQGMVPSDHRDRAKAWKEYKKLQHLLASLTATLTETLE